MLTHLAFVFSACIAFTSACSCAYGTDSERFCRYSVVVRGEVTSSWVEPAQGFPPSDREMAYEFGTRFHVVKVEEIIRLPAEWKVNETIVFRTAVASNLCGTYIPLGRPMLILGRAVSDGVARTNMCDPTMPAEEIGTVLFGQTIQDICQF